MLLAPPFRYLLQLLLGGSGHATIPHWQNNHSSEAIRWSGHSISEDLEADWRILGGVREYIALGNDGHTGIVEVIDMDGFYL